MSSLALNSILVQIARDENIESSKYDIDRCANHGYMAKVNTITLQDDRTHKVLHLFLKKIPDNVPQDFQILFENEANFYTIIMAAFREIIPANAAISMPLVPKAYYANKEFIVMEDLSRSDFKVWNPLNKPLNAQHVNAVMIAYGKFHAFSFALKRKRPDIFRTHGIKWEWFHNNHQSLQDAGYYRNLIATISAAFDAKIENESKYIDAVRRFFTGGQLDYFKALLASNETDVYVHGDCWTHNYMFRYDESHEMSPKDVCILDFQLVKKLPPVTDLSYFFATSACSQQVFANIEEHLRVYHDSLQENLALLECPLSIYSWEMLREDWHRYSARGFFIAAVVNKMLIADEDELKARKHIRLPERFDFVSRNEKAYQERMRIIVQYFCDNEIITQW